MFFVFPDRIERSVVKGKGRRTVVGNGSALGESETIRTIESGDLSVWKLCEIFRLLVVFEMLVISHDFELKATQSSDAPNLRRVQEGIEQALRLYARLWSGAYARPSRAFQLVPFFCGR